MYFKHYLIIIFLSACHPFLLFFFSTFHCSWLLILSYPISVFTQNLSIFVLCRSAKRHYRINVTCELYVDSLLRRHSLSRRALYNTKKAPICATPSGSPSFSFSAPLSTFARSLGCKGFMLTFASHSNVHRQ